MMELRIVMLLVAVVAAGCQTNSPRAEVVPIANSENSASTNTGDTTATLYVQGMSCPLCASNIDKQLLDLGGVEKVTVDLGTGQVQARLSRVNPPTREQLTRAIQRSGFTLDRIEMPTERVAP